MSFACWGLAMCRCWDSFKALKDAGVAPDVSFWMDRPSALGVDDALRHSIYVLHTVQKLV